MVQPKAIRTTSPLDPTLGRWFFGLRRRVPELPSLTWFGGVLSVVAAGVLLLAMWAHSQDLLEQVNYAYALLAVLAALFVVSWPVAAWSLRGLEVEREMPHKVVAGESFSVTLGIRNRSLIWPAVAVELEDKLPGSLRKHARQSLVMGLRPRRSLQVRYRGTLFRRGPTLIERVEVRTRFPFGLFVVRRQVPARSQVLVYPSIGELAFEPRLELGRSLYPERTARPQRGGTDEYFGVREYRDGDEPRHIHWKVSARRGTLATREYVTSRATPLILLLDTRLYSQNRRAVADAELAISLAATLSEFCLRQGRAVGLAAFTPVPRLIPPRHGRQQMEVLLEQLALLRTTTRKPAAELLGLVPQRLRSQVHALLILLGPLATYRLGAFESSLSQLTVYSMHEPQVRKGLRIWEFADYE